MNTNEQQPKDADFFTVPMPLYEPSVCTPKVSAEFEGIAITAPQHVSLSAVNSLPICGTIRLPLRKFDAIGDDAIESTVLSFVNEATGQPFAFNLRPDKPKQPPADKLPADVVDISDQVSEEDLDKDFALEEHFNVDAFLFHPDFPRYSATYWVYAVLDTYKSNTVRISIEGGP